MTEPSLTVTRDIRLNNEAQALMGAFVDLSYLGNGTWLIKPNGKFQLDWRGRVQGSGITPWLLKVTTGFHHFRLSKFRHVDFVLIPF